MTKILDVYFHDKVVGQLIQDNHGEINFSYSPSWLDAPDATRISCSLPLQKEVFDRRHCQAFFGGILPEDTQKKLIARNLGISANNVFSMLEKIGGECAGALSLIPPGKELSQSDNSYHPLVSAELAKILNELPYRPLLAGEKGVRLSLAGVQTKLAVYVDHDNISIPLEISPSTHILKPDFTVYDGVIFNEAFCLQLAKKIGLSVAEAEVKKIEEIYYLLIKRYDRIFRENKVIRMHQEDFCQALNVLPTNKYQNEGGPSLKQSFDLIRRETTVPVFELDKMLNAVIFNFLIGNCDAHGKNFSLLYDDHLKLAPLYDLVCTLCYEDLDKKMAMKLGGEYHINKISINNFDQLADEIGFSKPGVRKRIVEIADNIIAELPKMEVQFPIQEKVSNLIKKRCQNFIKL